MSKLDGDYPEVESFIDPADQTPSHFLIFPDNATWTKNLGKFPLKTESELYVISLNDKPLFYVSSEGGAHVKMWAIARTFIRDMEARDPNFQHYIKTTENELYVMCLAKYLFVAYDSTSLKIRYDKISEAK